ncbi:MAG: hypothetical protein JO288_12370 [Hyphomicrobiales bacterium]|nr:hypothetical protein [Hyphomicrobiales bacterium]
MTTVATRERQIGDLEGFDIVIKDARTGIDLNPRDNGRVGPYPYAKSLKGAKTVADWRRDRFEAAYPGLTCDVLDADGNIVAAQTHLRTVRETYEGD